MWQEMRSQFNAIFDYDHKKGKKSFTCEFSKFSDIEEDLFNALHALLRSFSDKNAKDAS